MKGRIQNSEIRSQNRVAALLRSALLLSGISVSLWFNSVSAQTNLSLSASTVSSTSNMVAKARAQFRAPAISDFQRLQYYYAAYPESPAPGTEHGIFTLKPDRTWSGDWNSKIVPKPTREQLDAITPQQVDRCRRAAKFSNGAWKIATSQTNIALTALSATASDYTLLRLIIERDVALQKYQQLEQKVEALTATPVAPASESP